MVYTAKHLTAVANHKNDIIVEIDAPDLGVAQGVTLVIRMLPDEARAIAKLRARKADEAEKSPARPS